MRHGLWILLLLPTMAWAEDFACGNAARAFCANTVGLTQYIHSRDPSKVSDGTCTQIAKATTPAQIALVTAAAAAHPTHPLCYLKVVGGLAVDMDAGEQTAVDTALAAEAAARQALVDETIAQDFCNTLTMGTFTARVQTLHDALETQIDTITTIANNRTVLKAMNDTYMQAINKMGRCSIARSQVR